ncbi:MAG: tetratricopeptide repeat protein [Lachnospiraceae bacterium]|nr:tetratricopeptide repeat protein [Lachnospiraceae bacterium]
MLVKERSSEKKTHVPVKRVFTDRDEPRQVFWDTYDKACKEPDHCNVLHYYGRGGIGKSTLLHVLHKQLLEKKGYCVFYDMEEGTEMRRILTRMRNMLVKQYPDDFRFDFFDLTLLKFSELAGEHNEIVKKEDKTIIESNPVLSAMLDGVSLIPGISVVSTVVNRLTKGYHYAKDISEKHRKHLTEKAAQINDLQMGQLLDLMPEFFSRDLDECCAKLDKPVVFFLDTYERLVNYMSDVGVAGLEDRWLREGIVQYTHNSMWVIAGRDRLRWGDLDPNWKNDPDYSDHLLGQLGRNDSVHYLREAGIADEDLCEGLFTLTDGDPLYLDICVSTWQDLTSDDKTPVLEDFGDRTQLVSRYLKYMDSAHRDMVELLACVGRWKDSEIRDKVRTVSGTFSENVYRAIVDSTLVQSDTAGGFYIHRVVRESVMAQIPQERVRELMEKLGGESTETEAQFSLDYVAELENDVDRVIEGMKKDVSVPAKSIPQKTDLLKKQGNYRELCRSLEPLYRYQESVGFKDFSVYSRLKDYLYALGLTDQSEQFLEKASRLYNAYIDLNAPDNIRFSAGIMLADAYTSNRRNDEALALAEKLKAELEKAGKDDYTYTTVLDLIGGIYRLQNRYSEAISCLEKVRARQNDEIAAGKRTPEGTVDTLLHLGNCYRAVGRPEDALKVDAEGCRIQEERYGPDHLLTMRFLNSMALDYSDLKEWDKQEEILRHNLEVQKDKYGPLYSGTLMAMNNLSIACTNRGKYQEALDLDQQCYELRLQKQGEDHPNVLHALHNLAVDYKQIGEKGKAKKLNEQALEGFNRIFGQGSLDSLDTLYSLSSEYDSPQEWAKGEETCRQALEICELNPDMEKKLADYRTELLKRLSDYCRRQKKFVEAEQADNELLEHIAKLRPDNKESCIKAYRNLTDELYKQKKYSEALKICREGIAYAEENLPKDHSYALNLMEWQGFCLRKLNDPVGAEQADRELLERVRTYGQAQPKLIPNACRYLTNDLYDQKRYNEALETCREGLSFAEKNLPKAHESAIRLLDWQAYCLRKLNDKTGAAESDRKLLELLKAEERKHPELMAKVCERLIRDVFNLGSHEEALQLSLEGAAMAEDQLSPDNSTAITLLEWPGYCLRKLNRYQEAFDSDKHCWEKEKQILGESHKRTLKAKNNMDYDAKKMAEAAANAISKTYSSETSAR